MFKQIFFRSLSCREQKYVHLLVAAIVLYTVYQFFLGTLLFNAQTNQQDFVCYYAAAKALSQGKPIYNPSPWPLTRDNVLSEIPVINGENPHPNQYYLYPPFLAWSLQPFTWIPYSQAEWLWNILLVISYWLGAATLLRYFYLHKICSSKEIIAFAFLAAYWAPMFLAIRAGQVTPIVFCLVVIHIVLSLSNKDILSGIVLALSIALKFSPLFLIPLWFLSCRWKMLLSTFITLLFIVLLTGWQKNYHFLTAIFPHVALGEIHPINHTIMGIYLRQTLETWGWLTPQQYASIQTTHTLMRFLLMTGWIITFWGIWRKNNARLVLFNISIVLTTILVFSPVARLHDFVYLYISLFLYYLELRRESNKAGWFIFAFTILVLIMNFSGWMAKLSWNPITEDLFGKPPIIAACMLWLIMLLRQKRLLYEKVDTP